MDEETSQKKKSKKNRECVNISSIAVITSATLVPFNNAPTSVILNAEAYSNRVLFSFRTRGGELLTTREHGLTKTEGWP